jgi:hypothetical protein
MPAVVGDLTTLDAVKAFLGVVNTDDDQLLQRLITQCSASVGNYLNRNLLTASYTEQYDGNNNLRLMLPQTPVTAVTSLKIQGQVIPQSSDGVTIPGYDFDRYSVFLIGYVFYDGIQNIAVSYTAGYATVPYDVEEAVVEFVSDRYRLKGRIGEKSKSLPQGGSVSYDTAYMSDKVKGSLSNYKRLIPL